MNELNVYGDVGAGFQEWNPALSFANGPSPEGSGFGIHFLLTGTGGHAGNPLSPQIPEQYLKIWSHPDGTPDLNTYFSAASRTISVRVVSRNGVYQDGAGWSVKDEANPHTVTGFTDVAGSTLVVSPSADFNLAVFSPEGILFSQAYLNPGSYLNRQFVSVFTDTRKPGTVYVGFEESHPAYSGKGDFDDLVLEIQAVPEGQVLAGVITLIMLITVSLRFHRR